MQQNGCVTTLERLEMSKIVQVVYADDGPQKVRALDKARVMSRKPLTGCVNLPVASFGFSRFSLDAQDN